MGQYSMQIYPSSGSILDAIQHRNGQITTTGFNSAWRRLREAAGLTDVNFHDIRAKAITDAHQRKGLDYAQALAGHENRDQTEAYIKKKNTEGVDPIC